MKRCQTFTWCIGDDGIVRETWLVAGQGADQHPRMSKHSPFGYFKNSPEIIRLAEMLDVRFPVSQSNVEYLLHERGIDMSQETVR